MSFHHLERPKPNHTHPAPLAPLSQHRWRIACCLGLLGLLLVGFIPKRKLVRRALFWAPQIRLFERLDKRRPPKPGGILFTGSSSIRYWRSLKRDMAPLPVMNRGFGGSYLYHVLYYTDRIVLPYRPRLIVLYAGENDISGGICADQLLKHLKKFVKKVHKHLPKTRIFYVSVKPTVLRRRHWKRMKQINQGLKAWIDKQKQVEYIDIATPMLSSKGQPRRDILIWDRLHLNRKGYRLWTSIIKPRLQKAWKKAKQQPIAPPPPVRKLYKR